jgi:hypothetical protein
LSRNIQSSRDKPLPVRGGIADFDHSVIFMYIIAMLIYIDS